MAWFKKEKTPKQPQTERRLRMPEGLWVKCEACKEMIYKKEVLRNANVCPKCNYHFRIDARQRLRMLLDDGAYEEFDTEIAPVDALGFRDTKAYASRLTDYQKRTGLQRCVHLLHRHDRRTPGRARSDGVRLHGRLDGQRGGREGDPLRRAGAARPGPADHRRPVPAARACRKARSR